MNADERRLETNSICEKIIGCAYNVANVLGTGFLEKVYENALCLELTQIGMTVTQQKAIQVKYKNVIVGDYISDILVNNSVIIELKAQKNLDDAYQAQCINYLKATHLNVCLLINFGKPRIEIKRIVFNF
ncbi:MAG: GxxExxY protein [Methylotenera sp.]|nr:GxxExxY protein [Methylotenera sp.]